MNVQQKKIVILSSEGQPVLLPRPNFITTTFTGTGVPPNLVATIPPGEEAVVVLPFDPPTKPGTYTAQAHFAGLTLSGVAGGGILLPSDSDVESFTIT